MGFKFGVEIGRFIELLEARSPPISLGLAMAPLVPTGGAAHCQPKQHQGDDPPLGRRVEGKQDEENAKGILEEDDPQGESPEPEKPADLD